MIKGLAVLFAVLVVLMGLLVWAKSRPGPGAGAALEAPALVHVS